MHPTFLRAVALTAPIWLAGCAAYLNPVPTSYAYDGYAYDSYAYDGYGAPPVRPAATPLFDGRGPVIELISANPGPEVAPGQTVTVQAIANDRSGELLSYHWAATGGAMTATTGRMTAWKAPKTPGDYTLTLLVTNGHSASAAGSLTLIVAEPASVPGKAAPTPAPRPWSSWLPIPHPTPLVTPKPSPTPTPRPTPAPDDADTVSEDPASGV